MSGAAIFICGNLGLALPVIGVGVVPALATPVLADRIFAGVIAALAVAGLAFGLANQEEGWRPATPSRQARRFAR